MKIVSAIKKELKLRWGLYLLLLPTFLYVVIFLYGPMGGVMMAFQDYKASLGLLKSPFVGLKHFRRFLTDYNFKTIFLPCSICFLLRLQVYLRNKTKRRE